MQEFGSHRQFLQLLKRARLGSIQCCQQHEAWRPIAPYLPAGPVEQNGPDSHSMQQEEGQHEKGSSLGGFFSREDSGGGGDSGGDSDSGGGGGSGTVGSDTAFRDDAFETNFGRNPSAGSGGGRLDGDAGIGSSLGTAYALD